MTNAKNALKKQSKRSSQPGIIDIINSDSMKKQFEKALPKYITPDKFVRIALTAINSNPELAQCTQTSLLAAMMNSAQLGLEFNTPLGEAYLIPYRNKKTNVVTANFQVGYQGLLKLAYNTGAFKRITAREVRENEEFDINYGTGEINHKPCLTGNSGNVIGYYAIYQTKDGGQDVFYFSKEDAENYGKTYSKTYNSGPWKTNFDAMAKKSALIQVLKYAPKTTESQKLIGAMNTDNSNIKDYRQEDNGSLSFDVDYEIEVKEDEEDKKTPIDPPENVDTETGEIKGDQDDFFGPDFEPVKE